MLYSRSFGIAGGVVAGGVTVDLDESAGGVVAGGVVAGGIVWVADIANATLIRNTSWIEVFAIGFGASVVAGIAGATGVVGAVVAGAIVVGAVVVGVVVVGVVIVGVVVVGVVVVGVVVVGAVATSLFLARIDAQLTDKAFESGVVT